MFKTFELPSNTLNVENAMVTFIGHTFADDLLSFENDFFTFRSPSNIIFNCNKLNATPIAINQELTTIHYNDIKEWRFIHCTFEIDVKFKKEKIDSLIFEDCIFKKRCYINKQYGKSDKQIQINNFKVKNTIFSHNFKLHNTIIEDFNISDTDFLKNADFFKSIFKNGQNKQITFHTINFNELALFGDTKFYEFLQFKYVTFKGYTHFRSALFKKGLDLDYANIEKEMNFFDIKIKEGFFSKNHTSQETYRIIKYQLQQVGNTIDSNKYHAYELKRKRKNTFLFSFDYIVLFFHWISSNHSRWWFLSLIWILIVGVITCEMLASKDCSVNIFKYISIFHYDDCIKNKPMIFFFNKVTLGYLYYQFLTAIRRDTRK